MEDPLTAQTHADALEELLAAAVALLDTCGEVCTRPATRDDPAEHTPSHEWWAEDDLKRAVASTRAVLNAEVPA